VGNRTAILRSKKSYETGSTAAPISAARFRHSTNSATRLSPAFKRGANRLQRHLPRVPLISCFRPQNCGAVSRCSAISLLDRQPRSSLSSGNQTVPYVGMDDDAVFRALADASRRQLLDRLHGRNGQTLGELCQGLDMTRQAVAKHLAILQEANLVSWKRNGREKLHFINPVPINEIAERWISKFDAPRLNALSELKRILEGKDHG